VTGWDIVQLFTGMVLAWVAWYLILCWVKR